MHHNKKINGKNIYLRTLKNSDVSYDYLSWMKNTNITKYMDTGSETYTKNKLKNYIEKSNKSKNDILFGIFISDSNKHIGNIKLDKINYLHKRAHIGIMIGDINEWSKGYGTESIRLLTNFAFKILKLHKLKAGVMINNKPSIKLFKNSGFTIEAKLVEDCFYKNKFIDSYIFYKTKKNIWEF